MTRVFEFSSNCFVAVELTIDDNPGPVVLARDWLITGPEVNNTEACMTKSNPVVQADPMALGVGAAVMEALGCPLDHFCCDWIPTGEERDYPAHSMFSCSTEDDQTANEGSACFLRSRPRITAL
jgi:hypothetical protein